MTSTITFELSDSDTLSCFDVRIYESLNNKPSAAFVYTAAYMHGLYDLVLRDVIPMQVYYTEIKRAFTELTDKELSTIEKYSHKNTLVGFSVREVIAERALLGTPTS